MDYRQILVPFHGYVLGIEFDVVVRWVVIQFWAALWGLLEGLGQLEGYTHHNDTMTSAPNNVQSYKCLKCTSHGVVMMSVSHSLVSRLFGASLGHS